MLSALGQKTDGWRSACCPLKDGAGGPSTLSPKGGPAAESARPNPSPLQHKSHWLRSDLFTCFFFQTQLLEAKIVSSLQCIRPPRAQQVLNKRLIMNKGTKKSTEASEKGDGREQGWGRVGWGGAWGRAGSG